MWKNFLKIDKILALFVIIAKKIVRQKCTEVKANIIEKEKLHLDTTIDQEIKLNFQNNENIKKVCILWRIEIMLYFQKLKKDMISIEC